MIRCWQISRPANSSQVRIFLNNIFILEKPGKSLFLLKKKAKAKHAKAERVRYQLSSLPEREDMVKPKRLHYTSDAANKTMERPREEDKSEDEM